MSSSNPFDAPTSSYQTTSATSSSSIVLRKVDIMSVGMIFGVMYAIIGLLAGMVMALFAIAGAVSSGDTAMGFVGGAFAAIIMPIAYGVGGLIGGIVLGLIYNVCAAMVGGIRFEIDS